MIELRPAKRTEAAEIASLLCRSITELCVLDHKNDAAEIAAWTANKTPDAVRGWISDEQATLITAYSGNELAGVGAVDAGGEILLLYIHPDHRFVGVSDSLLKRMVENNGAVRLTSTFTARAFYRKRGWSETGKAMSGGVPMQLFNAVEH